MCGIICGPSIEYKTYSKPIRIKCKDCLKYGVKRTCKKMWSDSS